MDKKIYTRKECMRIIKNNGFIYDHSTGGHNIYKKGEMTMSLPSKQINPMLFKRIMKEYGLKEVY